MFICPADGIQFSLDSKSRNRAECFEEDVPAGSSLKVELVVLRETFRNVATCIEVQAWRLGLDSELLISSQLKNKHEVFALHMPKDPGTSWPNKHSVRLCFQLSPTANTAGSEDRGLLQLKTTVSSHGELETQKKKADGNRQTFATAVEGCTQMGAELLREIAAIASDSDKEFVKSDRLSRQLLLINSLACALILAAGAMNYLFETKIARL
ncbi:hypothetical protein NDN08_006275 [Rhodosorus marinus]|uniref:GOLD domain-containing protein n=1 Tax=Rhodosorus marinus TaxID=101924 RepID=A0AAV8UK90_9RHOD|nr:hypothetical protein NDN08_006275 [Rhodosorus marinus]